MNGYIYKRLSFVLSTLSTALVFCFSGLQADVGYVNNTNVTTSPQFSQAWEGSMGMLFSVNNKISVTSLGAFSNGSPTFNQDVTVQLWDSANTVAPITSTVLSPLGIYSQIDQSLFANIIPVALTPGNIYAIVAYGFGAAQLNGNGYGGPVPWTVSPFITAIGSGIYDFPANNGFYPGILDTGPANRYEAGTFQFVNAPEPTTYAILGTFIAFTLLIQSRRKSKQLA